MQKSPQGGWITGALLLIVLQGCAATQTPQACPVPSQKPMLVAELFFGREVKGGRPVSDADWNGFVDAVVARKFPDGFTVLDGVGAWRDPALGQTVHEHSKVLIVAATPSPDLAARLQAVSDAYRRAFRQQSVGIVTTESCGAF